MHVPQNIIAVIFDFDDTLTDDSTTKLLVSAGVNPSRFWREQMPELYNQGWDPSLAYLQSMLDLVGKGKPLDRLSNAQLRQFGSTLTFYKGIPQVFDDLHALVRKFEVSRPAIEFYAISGGLEEIVRGSTIAKYFHGIWGCCFAENDGVVRCVQNVISSTEKTKYIFAINKGMHDVCRKEPYKVNEFVDAQERRIPIENMIYIGDGLTDVPCFSVVSSFRGKAFGVFDPTKEESPKKAWEKLIAPKRVVTMNSPHYGPKDDLGALLRAAVTEICLRMDTRMGAVRM
jgi:phosphoserine phosphatase